MFQRRMTFGNNAGNGGGDGGRSTSCPRPRAGNRSVSSPRQRPNAAWDVDRDEEHSTSPSTFAGLGESSVEDLKQTIVGLRSSVMAHAESSAESAEHLAGLRAAHDNLYSEHLRLQEQMDDAVELLKYLKEEKGSYEVRIMDLTNEVNALRDMTQGDVVSMTISNLTKEKMNLESMLAEERRRGMAAAVATSAATAADGAEEEDGSLANNHHHHRRVVEELECRNGELVAEVEGLRRAYAESKTMIKDLERTREEEEEEKRRSVEDEARAANLGTEREVLLGRVEELEGKLRSAEATTQGKEVMQARKIEDYQGRLRAMAAELERERSSGAAMKRELDETAEARTSTIAERDALLEERESIAAQRDEARDELRMTRMQLESEREEHVEQRRSIEAERDALLEERESIAAQRDEARDELRMTRTQQQEDRRRRRSSSSGGGGDDEDDDRDLLMERMHDKFENLERINRELVQEGQEMKIYATTMAETLTRKDEEHETAENEFQNERRGLQKQLATLREQMEGCQRMRSEAEDKVRELRDRLEEQSVSSQQYPESLEKEMQERLSKRIAMQLHDTKLAMEAQIREELEAEYAVQQEDGSRSISELEIKLRRQLSQAKSEQEDLMMKVRDSQQQFQAVREGFKKKLDKEKNRCRDLEKEKDGQQMVIEKMLDEHQGILAQLEELQENERSRQEWEEDRSNILRQHQLQLSELGQHEEEYTNQIHQLQKEIDELMNEREARDDEYEQLEDKKRSLMKRYKEKDDELRRALDDLEHLNAENADYVRRIEAFQNASNDSEDSRVKFSVLQIEHKELKNYLSKQEEQKESVVRQLELLNIENGDLQNVILSLENNLSSTQGERNALHDSLRESREMCSQLESALSANKREETYYEQKLDELQNNLTRTEAASAAAVLAAADKEKAMQDLVEMESTRQKVVAELQSQISDATSQISKLIDQLSIASGEKATLVAKFESVTTELSIIKDKADDQANKISQLESSLGSLNEERDAAKSRVAELLADNAALSSSVQSSLLSENNELLSIVDEREKTIQALKVETNQALGTISELQGKAERLAAELDASKSEISDLNTQIEVANRQQKQSEQSINEAEAKTKALQLEINGLGNIKTQIEVANQHLMEAEISKSEAEAKIRALQSEINELKAVNTQLTKANATAESQNASPSTQSTEAIEDLTKDLVEMNSNFQRLKRDHNDEVQKLNSELRELRDNSVALEEAVQDIQVEKEDLELENEELASKLADLTTQAKKMLLNNESLEEEIQDQQVEYEDRIAELERHAAELESKLTEKNEVSKLTENNDDNMLLLLQQKHEAALETIKILQKANDMTGQQKNDAEDDRSLKHIGEETSELWKGDDIVSELKARNEEISQLLRFSHEQNDAAADFIECLKSDNDKLRKVIFEYETNNTSINMLTMESHNDGASDFTQQRELQYYKAIVSQTANRLCDASASPAVETTPGFANQLGSSALVLAVTPITTPPLQLIQQIENLTIENGNLAQRLGNAVADKEFALTTLSKLGAKVEELMERNRLLSDPSGSKSQNGRCGARNYSGERNDERGRDPDEVKSTTSFSYDGEMAFTACHSSSGHDDATAYSDMASTIISYEPSKKLLEPESASVVGDMMEDDDLKRKNSCGSGLTNDPNNELLEDVTSSEPRSVKVPGGEYFGSLNNRRQKHGSGKMKYDNGNMYDGEWKNNKRDGKGITQYSSGNSYTGTWKAGKRHGFGVFHIKKTGDIYKGNWEHGMKSGAGVYEYKDGEMDISFYKEDVRLGEGVRWSASRHKASRLIDGQLVGEEGDMPLEDAMKLTNQLGFIV